LSLKDEK
jgi:cell division FtsZ-interacting protein ZapD